MKASMLKWCVRISLCFHSSKTAKAYAAAAADRRDIIPISTPVEMVIADGLVSLAIAEDVIGTDAELAEDERLAEAEQLGQKWMEVGSSRPASGTELSNEALRHALRSTLEFAKTELESLKVLDLSPDSFIRVGGKYFQPVAPEVVEDQPMVQSQDIHDGKNYSDLEVQLGFSCRAIAVC